MTKSLCALAFVALVVSSACSKSANPSGSSDLPQKRPALDLNGMSPEGKQVFIDQNLQGPDGQVRKWAVVDGVSRVSLGADVDVADFAAGAVGFLRQRGFSGLMFEEVSVSDAKLKILVVDVEIPNGKCMGVAGFGFAEGEGVFPSATIITATIHVKRSCLDMLKKSPAAATKMLEHEIVHALAFFGHVSKIKCLMADEELSPELSSPSEETLRRLYSPQVLPGAVLYR